MTLTFDWFPPTSGDGRTLYGRGHSLPVAQAQYAAPGISEFILSGYPHLEEAYWFSEGVLPELRRRGVWGSGVERELEVAGSAH